MSPITRLALVCLILAPAAARGGPVRFPDPQERLRILARQEARQVAPGEPALRAGQADYDVGFSSLDIDISDTANRRIYGAATHEIRSLVPSLTSVALDLVTQLTVDSVKVNGVPALFTRGGDQILTTLPSPLGVGQSCTLRVVYHGTPPQTGFGLYFDTHNNKAFVWNLSEPDGCRYWWPCKDRPDDKADSMDIRIIVPSWMTAASNGALRSVVSVTPSKLRYSWHVSYPIVPYLVSVAAGDFVRIDGTYPVPGGGTMPLAHYVFPELLTAATEDFNIAVPALDAYSSRFGPYPFLREKYGVSVFGWGGGMEHQTNTSYGWFLITGWHDYDWVYVHEMAHQWWGDNVTCATWADTWLNEGFASWAEAIWAEDQGGAADYRSWMVNVQTVSDPSGPVYNYPDPFDGNTIYNKGSWVAHMLRGVLGDATFFAAFADYRAQYEGKSVTTAQFQAVMEATSGRDLDWFFNEWVYGVDRPKYRVSTLSEPTLAGTRLYVHLDQTQTTGGFFTMPVPIRVQAGGAHDVVLWNDPDHEDLVVDLPASPSSTTVDPDSWILRTVTSGAYRLNLVSADLADAPAQEFVSVPLVARGGVPPYQWSLVDAAPPGISLDPNTGVLSGIPTLPGDYAFRVHVDDSANPEATDTQRIFWTITPATVSAEAIEVPASGVVRITPNPASGTIHLACSAAGDHSVRWTVHDLAGRRVAAHTGGPEWSWDGRGTGGASLPAGLYLVRAHGAATQASGHVYLLR